MGQFRAKSGHDSHMILTCPSCRTRYQTDSTKFKLPGRNVRCAKCGEVWFQTAQELESELEPEPVMAPVETAPVFTAPSLTETHPPEEDASNIGVGPVLEVELRAKPLPRKRRSWGAAAMAQSAGWVALLFLIGAISWATIQYRQTIASLWPQSASFYAALGMPVNIRGVTLTNIAFQQAYEDGQPVLSVTGKVVNVSNRDQAVPEIRVVLFDDAKRELYHWTFDAGIPTLKPGAESAFVTRLSSPPPEARNLNVRFAESGDTR